MEEFINKWNPPPQPSTTDIVSEALNNQGPLKPRIGEGARLLATQGTRLEGIIASMKYRDQKLLNDVAAAKQLGNMHLARTLATELAQLRATRETMLKVRSIMEKTETRFMTYDSIGDVAVTIEPIISLMKNLKFSLSSFLPSAAGEITQMTDMLGRYMSKTQNQVEFSSDANLMNEDVENIMTEAAAVASDSTNARFPSTPANIDHVSTTNNTI